MSSATESLAKLGEQGKFLAREVPKLLASSNWPTDDAKALWQRLEGHANEAEGLVDALFEEGANEHFVEAAETLADIFLDLHAALGKELAKRRAI